MLLEKSIDRGKSPNSVKCPKCNHTEVGRTKRVGFIDKSLSLLGLYPYYCHHYSCRQRFYYSRR